jgi:Glycosyltransferase 61
LRRPGLTSVLCKIFDAERICRTTPNHIFSADADWNKYIHDSFSHLEPTDLPGCYLTSLRQIYLYDRIIYFGGGKTTTLLYELQWPPDRPSTLVQHGLHLREDVQIIELAEDQTYFYLGGSAKNYGHWLIDDLPRLAAVERLREIDPRSTITILVTASELPGVDEARRATLRRHPKLSDVNVQFIEPGVVHRIHRALYATPVSYHPVAKLRAGVRYVRETYSLREARGARRIFMTRPASSPRRLSNRQEVETFLYERGFEMFDAGAMTFEEQLNLFSDADIIVGIGGSAMANSIFSAPGTPIVHLCCKGWQDPFYWDLADACGHLYACVYGEPAPGEASPYFSAFNIDTDYLKAALGKLL